MKLYRTTNVWDAALQRIRTILYNFDNFYVSFSGGKDSGVLLNLVIQEAKRLNRLPVCTLFIDLEAQYSHTIDYVTQQLSRPEIDPYWICLPLSLRNAVSQRQPKWQCWEIGAKERWVRQLPQAKGVINDPGYFPFFKQGMEFEEFIADFGDWFSDGKKTCSFVGIRSDESLNRWRTIANKHKETFSGHTWTTRKSPTLYSAYPIYDWHTKDIWVANGQKGWQYNRIYDLMHTAGLTIHQMRLCQPYGDSQRKGLHLFKMLEHETWCKIVNRVEGANFGARYAKGIALANRKIYLPRGHTWKSYTKFLLATMPEPLARHYREKFFKTLVWWHKNWRKVAMKNWRKYPEFRTQYIMRPIYDSFEPKFENQRAVLTWRRFAKVLLKNDYWCTSISFSQTKRSLERKTATIAKYMGL